MYKRWGASEIPVGGRSKYARPPAEKCIFDKKENDTGRPEIITFEILKMIFTVTVM